MAIFSIGLIIQRRREEAGLTQEALAEGICSVSTLSRIENEERYPSKLQLERLMERLGYSSMSMDTTVDKLDFEKHELRFQACLAYMNKDFSLVRECLKQYNNLTASPTQIDEQFILMYEISLNENHCPDIRERLRLYERALRLTCPRYSLNNLPKVMTYDEILLLNHLAICYNKLDERDNSIAILSAVKDYYDHRVKDPEEALRTAPMVLYNLSKYLGMEKRYDECIEISDIGIRLARTTGRCTLLSLTLFNRGWALLHRNHRGDLEAAELSVRQAYFFCEVMDDYALRDAIGKHYEKAFGQSISP